MELSLKYPPTAENAPLFAEVAVAAAKDVSDIALNYSPESLRDVESIIDDIRGDGTTVDQFGSSLFCFGCYVGEVIARNLDGRWLNTAESPLAELCAWPMVVSMRDGACWNPIGKTYKRFTEGECDSLSYFFRVASGQAKSEVES